MTGIQLLAVLAAMVMAYLSYRALRRAELRLSEFALWTAIWLGLALVSIFPARLRAFVVPLQVARLLDLVVIAGMFVLGATLFHLNRSVRRMDRRLEALVQHLALAPLLSADQYQRKGPGAAKEGVDQADEEDRRGVTSENLAL